MANRIESAPRKIKRIKKEKEKDDSLSTNELAYTFYRLVIHPPLLRLKNEKDKRNYSLWLARLDSEKSNLKMHLIKILFVSLKKDHPFYIFLNPPPNDLSELNLQHDNTMEMIQHLQNITDILLAEEEVPEKPKFKRIAAVAADMCSYSCVKTSENIAQTFYASSDFPLYTWYNPLPIYVPDNTDHNQWELYLNRFEILTELNKENKHKNECKEILGLDQESKVVASNFRWHPYSILCRIDRPKRSAGFFEVDQDITNQPSNQQQIDETAFGIIHKKTFPGYKMLNPKIYCTVIMPDPNFVFQTTGVIITYNSVSHMSQPKYVSKSNQSQKKGRKVNTSKSGEQNSSLTNDDKTTKTPICTNKLPKQPLPCPTVTNNNNFQNSCQTTPHTNSTTQKQMNCSRVKAGNNCDYKIRDKSCDESCFPISNSNKSHQSANRSNSRMPCESNTPTVRHSKDSSCFNNSSQNCTHFNQSDLNNNNLSRVRNNYSKKPKQYESSMNENPNFEWSNNSSNIPNPFESSQNETSKYDWSNNNSNILNPFESSQNETSNYDWSNNNSKIPNPLESSLNEYSKYNWNISSINSRTANPHVVSLNDSSNYDWTMSTNNSKTPNPKASSSNETLNYDWTMSSDEILQNQSCTNCSNRSKNNACSRRYYEERNHDNRSSFEPFNRSSPCRNQMCTSQNKNSSKTQKYSNQRSRQCHTKKYKEQRSCCNKANLSRSVQLLNDEYLDESNRQSRRKSRAKKPQKLNRRCLSAPCDSKCTNHSSRARNISHGNPNVSYQDYSECTQNQTKPYNVSNGNVDKSLVTKTGYSSIRNENTSRSRYDDHWEPEVGSYSTFLNNVDNFLTSERKKPKVRRQTSLVDVPPNIDILSDYTDYSDFSIEMGASQMQPTKAKNSDYYSNQATDECSKYQFDGDCNTVNEPMEYPKRNDSVSWGTRYPDQYQMQNIEDVSMIDLSVDFDFDDDQINSNEYLNVSHRNVEESRSDGYARNEYVDIRDISMPDLSYETSSSENDNESMISNEFQDIRDISMPNISFEDLSNNDNYPFC